MRRDRELARTLLRKFRTWRDLSQQELGNRLGYTGGYIHQLEVGTRPIPAKRDTAIAIVRALTLPEVAASYFLASLGLAPLTRDEAARMVVPLPVDAVLDALVAHESTSGAATPSADTTRWASPEGTEVLTAAGLGLPAIDGAIAICHSSGFRGWNWGSIDVRRSLVRRSLLPDLERLRVNWAEKATHKNGPKWRLDNVEDRFSDELRPGEPSLVLDLSPTDFYTLEAINYRLDRRLKRRKTIRQMYAAAVLDPASCKLSSNLSVSLAIVSHDDKVLLCKRRTTRLAIFRGYWSASIEESLNGPGVDDPGDEGVFEGAMRGLREEVGLDLVAPQDITFLAMALEVPIFTHTLLGFVRTPFDASEVVKRWPLKRQDQEAALVVPIEVTPEALAPYLCRELFPNPSVGPNAPCTERWLYTARMRLLFLLFNRFGVDETLTRLERAVELL